MLRRWIARLLLAILTLEAGLVAGLYLGQIDWLAKGEALFFRTLLAQTRDIDFDNALLENPASGAEWHLRPLTSGAVDQTALSLIDLTHRPELFDGETPTPAEMAYLLTQVYKTGARRIALTTPLAWEQAPEIELRTLDSVLSSFDQVLLPLEMSEVPRADQRPDWLRDSLLAPDSLSGDASGLPLLNTIKRPPSVTPAEQIQFSFPDFGARDFQYRAENRIPLIARWGKDLLPAWPLFLALHLQDITAADLTIDPGNDLRFGANGPVVPLDDHGSAKLTSKDHTLPPLLPVIDLIPLEDDDLPELSNTVVILDRMNEITARGSDRMLREALALLAAPRPGPPEVFTRLSLIWEVAIYLEIIIVAIFALHVRAPLQLLSLIALTAALGGLLYYLLHAHQLWTPVTPLLIATTVAWCLVGYLQQVAHPVLSRGRGETSPPPNDTEEA